MDNPSFTGLDALMYDEEVPDWPGEIDFYRKLALETRERGQAVLEIACGTGRVAARLAEAGVQVTGQDLSDDMLDIARKKTEGMENVRWVQGNMRAFDLHESFGLILIPGHSFLFMLSTDDQLSCLQSIYRHLHPGGVLVAHLDHQDLGWLGEIGSKKSGVFESASDRKHPQTGNTIKQSYAWSYEGCTQTATLLQHWEELNENGEVIHRWEWEPKHFHCVFRYEMEHLLVRTGFEIMGVYGDFFPHDLGNDSTEMIWMARRPVE